MITKLYEYLLIDQRMKDIRLTLQYLNNKYVNKKVSFDVHTKVGRKYKDVTYTEEIETIDFDRRNFRFIVKFQKPETYIIIKSSLRNKDISFHERYERLPKTIKGTDENLTEIITKLQNL